MHSTLENVYFISQIALTLIAALAAYGAYDQLKTIKKFEFLKILESENVREARRQLFMKLVRTSPAENWWDDDPETEKAASTVCASFDIVGIMARGTNRRFFTTEWARPIWWTYRVLEPYIAARNPDGYRGFRKLFQEAEKHQPTMPSSFASLRTERVNVVQR